MEQIVLEAIKLGDVATLRGLLMFFGAWYLLHREIKKPIREVEKTFNTRFEGLEKSINSLTQKVENNLTWRVKIMEDKVEDIEKKITLSN